MSLDSALPATMGERGRGQRLVAFAGLGTMGHPMCVRLARCGWLVLAYDNAPDACRRVAAIPRVTIAADPTELAQAKVLVTMLPDGDAVRDLVTRADLLEQNRNGALVIDCSSSAPAASIALGEELREHGSLFVDAPVSGSPETALHGELTLMVGGTREAVAAAQPVLATLGQPQHVGEVGSGHALKALNNVLSAVNLVAAAEVMLAGAAFGIAPEIMLSVINRSTGRNDATERKIGQFVLSGSFASGFSMDLMHKDIRIALGIIRELGLDADFAATCDTLWASAKHDLPGVRDNVEVVRWMEERARTKLRDQGTGQP